jgi:hypothetical protein
MGFQFQVNKILNNALHLGDYFPHRESKIKWSDYYLVFVIVKG